jgi:putative heme transporter
MSNESDPTTVTRPWWRSRTAQVVLSVAVVALIFGFFFPKVADYGEVWDTITAMTAIELATLGAVAAWNLVSYWPMLTSVQPGLRLREAAVANLASTAVANTLPGGGALGVGVTMTMQRSWGIPVSSTALATVVSGIWNNFVKLGLPVVALALLAISGGASKALITAAVVGLAVLVGAIVLFALLLRSETLAARIGTLAGRVATTLRRSVRMRPVERWDDRAVAFRTEIVALLEHRWLWITTTSLVSHLSLFAVLLIALRHVGVSNDEVEWQQVLAAFAFVRLVSAVPITPGGLGLVELGLTAALGSGLPDGTKNQIAAAVLLYRALTWLAPIPLGVMCWLFWRSNRSWRQDPDQRPAWRIDDDAAVAPGTVPLDPVR